MPHARIHASSFAHSCQSPRKTISLLVSTFKGRRWRHREVRSTPGACKGWQQDSDPRQPSSSILTLRAHPALPREPRGRPLCPGPRHSSPPECTPHGPQEYKVSAPSLAVNQDPAKVTETFPSESNISSFSYALKTSYQTFHFFPVSTPSLLLIYLAAMGLSCSGGGGDLVTNSRPTLATP